jgi:putative FmdB family regulatory protein
MPVYEYQCKACGTHLEHMQRISEPLLTVCPKCGGELRKLLSLSSFQLKGSGWYVTDYRGKNPANGNGDGNGKPAETKKENKPETRTETTNKSDKKPSATD